jgi:hypothetical protein
MNKTIPIHFCIYGNQLMVGPVPDKTTYRYHLNYTAEDTTVVASDTDPVPFMTNYKERNVVRDGVLMELYDGLNQFEESNYYRALYERGKVMFEDYEHDNTRSSANIEYSGF